jgi:putative flippase GtrA
MYCSSASASSGSSTPPSASVFSRASAGRAVGWIGHGRQKIHLLSSVDGIRDWRGQPDLRRPPSLRATAWHESSHYVDVAIMKVMLRRAFSFGVAGSIATVVSYLGFIGLLKVTNYVVAATGSWVLGVACGFALNRRFTFGISGPAGQGKHLALFLLGAVLQYGLAMVGYAILLGRLQLNPSLAFIINLPITTSFSFAFQNLVVFRRAAEAADN